MQAPVGEKGMTQGWQKKKKLLLTLKNATTKVHIKLTNNHQYQNN